MGVQERITTTVSTKGQVILPKAIREQKHWAASTKLIVEETDEGVLLKAAPVFPTTDIEAIDEMNEVISEEAERRARD